VGVGSTASIQAHDNKVMYNGQWWPKEGQNTDHDDRFFDHKSIDDVQHPFKVRNIENEIIIDEGFWIREDLGDIIDNKYIDALERRV